MTYAATRRDWIGLAVIALPCVLYSMDLTVLNLGVPHLTADLKPSSSQMLWIMDIYGFMVAGSLITMGTLGDRIGRRKLLLIGAAAFGAASVLAAFSISAEMLIATRALLGIAGATLAPSTLSLIRNMFQDPKQRTTAIGIWISSFSVGGAIGPLLGGIMLEHFWWGSVFLLGVPVMLLLLVLGPILLPEFKDPSAGQIDLVSAILSLTSVLSVLYGVKKIAESSWALVPILSILAGLLIGFIFICRQKRLVHPLIDLRLFQVPDFASSLAIYTLSTFVTFGSFFFVPQYLQLVLEKSPLEAGLWTLPWSFGFVAGSMLTPKIVKRVHPASVIGTGLVLGAIGFGILVQVGKYPDPIILVIGSTLLSFSLSPVFTLSTDVIVGSAPPERAGSAAAISETCAEFGGALGIAILGSIGIAVYRGHLTSLIPATIPLEAAEIARSTLGGALTIAQQLPNPLGIQLIAMARVAFVHSFVITATVSAFAALATAIIAKVLLRNLRSSPES